MSEQEWLTGSDPRTMLNFLRGMVSDRKVRLFACACYRSGCTGTETAKSRRTVDVAERYADGLVTYERLARAWSAGTKPIEWLASKCGDKSLDPDTVAYYAKSDPKIAPASSFLLRDIFGNPFRPVVADPAWLTATAVSIASAVYADRAFDRLPILADALEEAGCTDADVLLHCRQPGEHVRGCWAVDLVLGKE